tara:strand:+ start:456 stop:629 length:174 start_codon:yes stop_codon:yes gene_type:complete
MNIENMILYFAKKNKILKREVVIVLRNVKIMKLKGISEKNIYNNIPKWCKETLNDSR